MYGTFDVWWFFDDATYLTQVCCAFACGASQSKDIARHNNYLTGVRLELIRAPLREAFADRCGFARSYMSRIECGGANPSLDAIETLADALGIEVKTFFETVATISTAKPAKPVTVPFADDGSCFNPSLRRIRTGKFTVGEKGKETAFDSFEAAVDHLKAMKTAYWRRPNKAGNWGRVVAVRWGTLPKKYLPL